MQPKNYKQAPLKTIKTANREIAVFDTETGNIDLQVVNSFGDEWAKFHDFPQQDLQRLGDKYFEILDDSIINKNSYCIDIGCGTGRWTKTLLPRIGFMEAIDPSHAIFSADKLLGKNDNVRLSIAATDTIPFEDNTFDFAMSVGVLHHIPDTPKALADCVKKVKKGGHFYTYLYYSLDNKGAFSKFLLFLVTGLRKIVSRLPSGLKRFVCDLLAIFIYMPFVLLSRFLHFIGLKGLSRRIPLSYYRDKSFYIIRNDSLDRFGTRLEQRFSKAEVREMMEKAGLENIIVSENAPYWHAVGRKK